MVLIRGPNDVLQTTVSTGTQPEASLNTEPVSYKKRYSALKRKLKLLVYEQECFVGELQKAQRKLLKVTRDRSFLLDRLLQYEKTEDSSSDSDVTASSDSDQDTVRDTAASAAKRKKAATGGLASQQPASSLLSSDGFSALVAAAQAAQAQLASSSTQSPGSSSLMKAPKDAKKKPKISKKINKTSPRPGGYKPGQTPVSSHMTREELERHLELKTSSKPQFMSIDKAPHSLPDDIFSHDNSNPDGDIMDRGRLEETELVIDLPH